MKVAGPDNYTQIRVVSPECFAKIVRRLDDDVCENISEWEIIPEYAKDINNPYKRHWLGYRVNVDKCYTKAVRSCVSGVVKSKTKNSETGVEKPVASIVMHIENSKRNIENLPIIKEFCEGESAILIGSKDYIEYSKQLFSKIKSYLVDKMPTTIMRNLAKGWEANIAYLSDENVLYLMVKNIFVENTFVKSLDELKAVFEEIFISKGAKLEVLSKCKECVVNNFDFKQAEKILKRMK